MTDLICSDFRFARAILMATPDTDNAELRSKHHD